MDHFWFKAIINGVVRRKIDAIFNYYDASDVSCNLLIANDIVWYCQNMNKYRRSLCALEINKNFDRDGLYNLFVWMVMSYALFVKINQTWYRS